MLSSIPTIPRLPIVGNIPALRADRLALFCQIQKTCGELGIFHFGAKPVLMVGDPALIQTLLVHHANSLTKTDRLRHLLQRTLGNGLLTLEGQSHREQRRLLAPVFQPRALTPYVHTIEQNTLEFMQNNPYRRIDSTDSLRELAMKNIHNLIFGFDRYDQDQTIHQALDEMLNFLNAAMTQLFMLPLWIPLPKYKRFNWACRTINQTFGTIIAARRAKPTDSDIISLIMRATNDQLSNEQIRDHVLALFFAGHRPLAAALTWMLITLAAHPEIGAKVKHEIDQHRCELSTENLQAFPYTLQFIKEVLRVYPPFYAFTRRTIKPIEIPSVGTLPAGLTLGFSPYAMHRNERFFPDSERIDPDRWTAEQEAGRPRYSYLPFGAGPHQCLGMQLAMLQLQTILITVIRHWGMPQLVDSKPITMNPTLVLEPSRSIKLAFTG